jgi:hypothetical protein
MSKKNELEKQGPDTKRKMENFIEYLLPLLIDISLPLVIFLILLFGVHYLISVLFLKLGFAISELFVYIIGFIISMAVMLFLIFKKTPGEYVEVWILALVISVLIYLGFALGVI